MYSTLSGQNIDEYNVSVTSGYTEILLSSDFVSYNGSTNDTDYNETSIIVLLLTTSSNSVSRSNGRSGDSSTELIAGITLSCVTCVIILMIVVALIVWRYRAIPQQGT